ncbi:hypothetical protein ZIOFF_057987 [Zingiber officinale]|uniref:Leucine-rich repeat-containing N-terminal plant-type domain-containing protein n=1 Tax=Zingiber officinale TaxID=94328 RepID=A0A8J5F7V5_ZINOF|nr:hypothetical protein ZIOFF_057987 [Zingiber officinale]
MHFFTLLLLFPLLVSATPPPSPPPPLPLTPAGRRQETQGEIDALTAFRLALCDPLGLLDGWDEASLSAPCDWRDVACEPNVARVVELRLPRLRLSGLISPRLADLRLLQRLSLRSNQFYRSIPPALASLGNLRSLFLQSNALSGPIRTFPLSNLSSLQVLSFAGNLLIGSVPAAFPPDIRYLDLSSNAFVGLVPAKLNSAATQLQFLDLSYNRLRGIIPGDLALSFLYRSDDLGDELFTPSSGVKVPTPISFLGVRLGWLFIGRGAKESTISRDSLNSTTGTSVSRIRKVGTVGIGTLISATALEESATIAVDSSAIEGQGRGYSSRDASTASFRAHMHVVHGCTPAPVSIVQVVVELADCLAMWSASDSARSRRRHSKAAPLPLFYTAALAPPTRYT